MKKHHAVKLYDYHVWANNKMFGRLKELPKEIYDREIQSVFPTIAKTLVHIYTVDTIWLGVMRENSMDEIQASLGQVQEKSKGKGLEEMERLFHELSEEYHSFLIDESDLDRDVSPVHPQFGRLETQLSELIQHVVNHGTYHRGNLTAMIRQQGYSSVPTDYVFYLYEINSKK
ncbi:DinB family protein [Bacillus sp. FJAT-22090]|uniref:DinB family protein n=1 Tax=Bacillus sp. FJAT-22090 TaxID=1581038 RepID=UPI00119F5C7F|nr:DinB family protein [Bacillus sp. FJAT-22090]